MKKVPPALRFDDKWTPEPFSGCWLWIAATNRGGYGNLKVNGKTANAHVVSYLIFKGSIPAGLFVLHKCDVRCCVNPDHLFLGSQKRNIRDAINKNRWPGGRSGKHKGPLRKIIRILKPCPNFFEPNLVELECGHTGIGYGPKVRPTARCRECGKGDPKFNS